MRDPRGGRRRGPSHQRGGLSPGSGLCPGGGDLPEAGTVHHGQDFRGRGGNLPGPADAADPEGADHGCGKGDPPAGAEGAGPGRGCGDLRDPRRGQRRDRDPGDGEGPAGGLTLPRVRGSRSDEQLRLLGEMDVPQGAGKPDRPGIRRAPSPWRSGSCGRSPGGDAAAAVWSPGPLWRTCRISGRRAAGSP